MEKKVKKLTAQKIKWAKTPSPVLCTVHTVIKRNKFKGSQDNFCKLQFRVRAG